MIVWLQKRRPTSGSFSRATRTLANRSSEIAMNSHGVVLLRLEAIALFSTCHSPASRMGSRWKQILAGNSL